MWGIFNEQLAKGPQNFGRCQYLFMYQLLNEECKREQALQMLLRVLYIDLSGVAVLRYRDMYRQGLYNQKQMREWFDVVITLAPGIVNPIKGFADVYCDEMIDIVYEQKLPIQVCDKKLFLLVVHSVLDNTYNQEVAKEKLKRGYYKMLREQIFTQ